MIVIVDYGMGNLRSILHKLRKMEIEAVVSSKAEDIERADRLVIPGVGHFSKGIDNLKRGGLIPVLNWKVLENQAPVLGICLGMQLFSRHSEEGDAEGLGWIDAETIKFKFNDDTHLKIPHVGWNTIRPHKKHPLVDATTKGQRFYFTHSYHVACSSADDILATTWYGQEFVSAVHHKNIVGLQFHPEKSHRRGVELLRVFAGRK